MFCPFGDDPTTADNADYTIQVGPCCLVSPPPLTAADHPSSCTHASSRTQVTIDTTDGASALGGTVGFWFSGQTTSTSLEANGDDATEAECKAAWESLANVATATCFKGTVAATTKSTTWTVRLVFTGGYMNNLHNHDGDPPLSEFACNKCVCVGQLNAGARWLALTHPLLVATLPSELARRAGRAPCRALSLRLTAR